MAQNVVTLNLNNTDYSLRPYGVCGTGATAVAKTVTIDGFTLYSGATVLVKFTQGNTAVSPTLNVNNTGAKPIKFDNDTSPVFQNNDTYEFVYNGTNWDLIGVGHLYTFDVNKNATFPANLTSTGALSANGITSTGALTVNGNTTLGDATTDTITIKGKTIIEDGAGLVIKGIGSVNHILTRGVRGSDGNGNVGPLYLQYGANKPIYFGNNGSYNISADGSQYSGKSADSTKFDGWTQGEIQSISNTNLYSIIDTTPLLVNSIDLAENCTIVTAPDNDSPFKKVWLSTGSTAWFSPSNKLFYVTPGDTICVESWIMRPKNATGTAGTYFLGIQFRDKNGIQVNGNAGTVYMTNSSNWTCPCDGVWHRIYDEYTIPKSHEQYTTSDGKTSSDGGGYFTGQIRLHLNYNQGTIPTYYGGFRIYRKVDIPTASDNEITNLF